MKVGVLFPSRFGDAGEFLADARAMEAAGVDSVWLDNTADDLDPVAILAAIAAVTTVLRLGLVDRHREPARRIETLSQLSRHRIVDPAERWRPVQLPADRDEWAQTLQAAARDGAGVLVPMDPRLLDIVRHPDDVIDRTDIVLAQG
jgi:hypothetical protein